MPIPVDSPMGNGTWFADEGIESNEGNLKHAIEEKEKVNNIFRFIQILKFNGTWTFISNRLLI